MKRVTIVENGKSSSEAEQDDEKYSYKNGLKFLFFKKFFLLLMLKNPGKERNRKAEELLSFAQLRRRPVRLEKRDRNML